MNLMMSIKIRYYLIFIFLCVLSTSNLFGQSFSLADSLFKEKKFFEASIEYERVNFYSKDNAIKNEASYRRSMCYRFSSENRKAINELQKINLFNVKKDLRLKVIYENIINSFLLKEYSQVELYVQKLKFFEKDVRGYLSVFPTYILSLNALRKWDEAEKQFEIYVDLFNISGQNKTLYLNKIKSLYASKNIPREYSVETAENWSRFIPGAGQFYTGNIAEGCLALGMCSAFALTAAYNFYYEYYFTGYILGIGFLHETYMGGITRVGYLAKRKNEETVNLFNNNCVELLIKINS
jgi:TM2 domain-containing membrane protein YozV